MKKTLVTLVLAMASFAMAGNGFNDSSGDHTWDNPANWDMGVVPQDATTDPSVAVPQWNNDVGFYGNDKTLNVGPGQTTASYSLQLGCYGGDNSVLNLSTGGTVNVGGWGMDIGRGNSNDHGTGSGTLNMTGGNLNVNGGLLLPQEWRNLGVVGTINGVANISGGVVNASFMRIGMFDGVGTVNLSGTALMNLSGSLQIDTGWGGWNEPDMIHSGQLNIDGGAVLKILTTPTSVLAEMQQYQDYIDLGWIASSTGQVLMSVNTDNTMITIVPEPATMLLLGLGGLLIRRKN